ncbi:hypothetical protein [Streptomyces sp. AM 3-1-1]|uniref:hypothetical protein n=1 Tax=Streptomyces sp. AM 3-1-1 TaxID=3028711 RepID=UPI0023B9BE65|nr:hypothetical protein [Streptomyces sp. AM 3-1-1]WEH30124.1 hypothetical protein P0D76_23940 [Streptomyces sp. AM 3-1-1]
MDDFKIPNYPPPPKPGEIVMAHWSRLAREGRASAEAWNAFERIISELHAELRVIATAMRETRPGELDVSAQLANDLRQRLAETEPGPLAVLLAAQAEELELGSL